MSNREVQSELEIKILVTEPHIEAISNKKLSKMRDWFEKKIPKINGFLKNIKDLVSTFSNVYKEFIHASSALFSILKSLGIISLILKGIDVICLPIAYISSKFGAKSNDKKLGISKLLRWIYSASMLVFACVSFAIPSISIILGLIAATTGLIESGFRGGYFLYKTHKLKQELANINKAIEEDTKAISDLKTNIEQLEKKLAVANQELLIITIKQQLATRYQQFYAVCEEKSHHLIALIEKKNNCEKELQKRDVLSLTDKAMGFFKSSVGFISTILSIAFPQVSAIIMLIVAALCLSYFIGRQIYSFIQNKKDTSLKEPLSNELEMIDNSSKNQTINSMIPEDLQTNQAANSMQVTKSSSQGSYHFFAKKGQSSLLKPVIEENESILSNQMLPSF